MPRTAPIMKSKAKPGKAGKRMSGMTPAPPVGAPKRTPVRRPALGQALGARGSMVGGTPQQLSAQARMVGRMASPPPTPMPAVGNPMKQSAMAPMTGNVPRMSR